MDGEWLSRGDKLGEKFKTVFSGWLLDDEAGTMAGVVKVAYSREYILSKSLLFTFDLKYQKWGIAFKCKEDRTQIRQYRSLSHIYILPKVKKMGRINVFSCPHTPHFYNVSNGQ